MSVPFYATLERQASLVEAAMGWRDTPFRLYNQTPGPYGGVDCILLLEGTNVATGCIEPIDKSALPRYPKDWSQHHGEELLEQWLDLLGILARSERIENFDDLMPGDVIVWRPGRVNYHVGQVLDQHFVMHILDSGTVRFDRLRHVALMEWFSYALRPLETEAHRS